MYNFVGDDDYNGKVGIAWNKHNPLTGYIPFLAVIIKEARLPEVQLLLLHPQPEIVTRELSPPECCLFFVTNEGVFRRMVPCGYCCYGFWYNFFFVASRRSSRTRWGHRFASLLTLDGRRNTDNTRMGDNKSNLRPLQITAKEKVYLQCFKMEHKYPGEARNPKRYLNTPWCYADQTAITSVPATIPINPSTKLLVLVCISIVTWVGGLK